jgi:CBS domain containing-hemolysin-like protein
MIEIIFIVSILLFLVLSSIYACTESAMFSLPYLRVVRLKEEGVKGADLLFSMIKQPQELLLTILIGDFMLLTFASAMTTSFMLRLFNPEYLPIIMAVFSLSIVIFKDIVPMSIAARTSESFSLRVIRFIYISKIIFTPLRWVLLKITRAGFGITSYTEEISRSLSIEDISEIVEVGADEGVLDESETRLITGIADIEDETVDEIMTPRTSFIAIEKNADVNSTIDLIKQTGHSRLPVFSGDIENVVGIITMIDILPYRNNLTMQIDSIFRKPVFIPEKMSILELLKDFRRSKYHMAFVIDEYGTVVGLITLDDILEEIFGEIIEPLDIFHFKYRMIDDKRIIVSGRLEIEDFEKVFSVKFPELSINTIGGFIISEIGRIPEEGDEFEVEDLRFTILSSNPKAIERMLVEKVEREEI